MFCFLSNFVTAILSILYSRVIAILVRKYSNTSDNRYYEIYRYSHSSDTVQRLVYRYIANNGISQIGIARYDCMYHHSVIVSNKMIRWSIISACRIKSPFLLMEKRHRSDGIGGEISILMVVSK